MGILKSLFNNRTLKKQLFGSLIEAAKESGADAFICKLDDGSDTGFSVEIINDQSEHIVVKRQLFDFYKNYYITAQNDKQNG